MRFKIGILISLSFIFANSVEAEIFMYTDENGKVHYTNTVPPQKAKKVTSSKETVESPVSKSMRLEQEQHDAEKQRVKNERERALRKRKLAIKRRAEEDIRRIDEEGQRKIKAIKESGRGVYLHHDDIVCKTGYDVGSYYYHRYNNNPLNVASLFTDRICWKLKGTRNVTRVFSKIEKHLYGKSVKIQYWDKGRKITAHTHPKNVKK